MPKINYGLTELYSQLPMIPLARPYVAVRLQYGGNYYDTMGLIDSGADSSLFNEQFASVLGLDLSQGQTGSSLGLGGTAPVVYFGIFLTVRGKRFSANVGFTKGIGPQFGLLGRRDFFQVFLVGFDQPSQQFFLHRLP